MLDFQPALDVALPTLRKLPECADVYKTIVPYIPQLYELPQKIFEHYDNWEALQYIYLSTNPFISGLAFALFMTPVVLIVSEINKNYSQVDRLWSILPVIYNCHYTLWAHQSGIPSQKLDHVFAVSVLWGARLTFNYWRKGGYSIGSEDYRWNIVKDNIGPYAMFIFNIVFISFAQNILLFLITGPTYVLLLCSRVSGNSLSSYDSLFSKLIFLTIIIEFYADQQQWNFHQAKALYKRTAKVPKMYGYTREQLDRGFNTSGLWAYSRHPNFAAEQGVWVLLYQWCCCESFTYMNWCFSGAISYLILFQGSTWLTEKLSAAKYPEYKVYQKRVGKFLPKATTESMESPQASRVGANAKNPEEKEEEEEEKSPKSSNQATSASKSGGKAKKRR